MAARSCGGLVIVIVVVLVVVRVRVRENLYMAQHCLPSVDTSSLARGLLIRIVSMLSKMTR